MNSIKILFGVIFLVFCYISLGESLKCYYCTSKASCQNPVLYTCNQTMVDNTTIYLKQHYQNVTSTPNGRYQCFRDELSTSSGEFYYRSCIDATIGACYLNVTDPTMYWKRHCTQCDFKDGCNPAMRTEISYFAMILTIVLTFLSKNIL